MATRTPFSLRPVHRAEEEEVALDGAYDQGGSGSGRSITADNGAVTIAGPASAGNEALSVSHDKMTK